MLTCTSFLQNFQNKNLWYSIFFLSKLVLDIFLPPYSERSRHIKGSKNWNSDIYIHCKVWVTYACYWPQKLESMFFEKYVHFFGPLRSQFLIIVTTSKLHIFLEFRTHWNGVLGHIYSGLWPLTILHFDKESNFYIRGEE